MTNSNFSHLIGINEGTRLLTIHRVFQDGRKQLFTETPLPPRTDDAGSQPYQEFARMPGQNILMDSPAARRALAM